jgi:NADPH-dependent 7-cyano-7-deazaguanine reductase QueF
LAKKEKEEKTVTYIKEYYQCTQQIAKDYYTLLSPEELALIVEYFEKRGTGK